MDDDNYTNENNNLNDYRKLIVTVQVKTKLQTSWSSHGCRDNLTVIFPLPNHSDLASMSMSRSTI